MTRLEELRQEYAERYGDNWDRCHLSESEEQAWVEACYDYYENHCQQKDVFGGPYTDATEAWYGHPFEIVRHIEYGEEGYDPIALPMWIIRITDVVEEDPGEFAAYPEELFVEP